MVRRERAVIDFERRAAAEAERAAAVIAGMVRLAIVSESKTTVEAVARKMRCA